MRNKNVLYSFDSLKKKSSKLQIVSATEVINHLLVKQEESGLDEPCEELKLGVARIIRGLGAPRSDSRRGFFITFVGLCKLFPSTVTVSMCFNVITKELKDFSSEAEEINVLKGQVLAYGALIRSGKILQASGKEIEELLKRFVFISGKKNYLMLAAHKFLTDFIEIVEEKTFKKFMWNIIKNEVLVKNKENDNLQWYDLLFVLSNKFPKFVNKEFIRDLFGHSKIVNKSNAKSVCQLLLTTPLIPVDIEAQICQRLISNLVDGKKSFKLLWSLVEEKLSSVTLPMISFVFKLFISCIEQLHDKNKILVMFTPHFIKQFESKSDIRAVEALRNDMISKFVVFISENNSLDLTTQKTLVEKLFFYPGNLKFFNENGLKIFNVLIKNLDEDAVKSICSFFIDVLNGYSMRIVGQGSNDEMIKKPWTDGQKKVACNIIKKLLNHPRVINSIDWKVEQIKIIIDVAFFPKVTASKLSEITKKCFYSALDLKFIKLSDMCSFFNELVMYLDKKLQNNAVSIEFNDKMQVAWRSMMEQVDNIADNKSNTDNIKLTNTVFRILYLFFGLTLFDDPEAAIKNLEELHVIHKQMCLELNSTKKKDSVDDLCWTDVVVDLILSLLSKGSHFYRNVILNVFALLCPHLSSFNIHHILSILNPYESNILTADVNDAKNTDSDEADNGEKKPDENDNSGTDEGESDTDEEMSEDESDIEEEMTGMEKVQMALREALGDAGAATDTESIDIEDLDEEVTDRLDKSLSEAFRQIELSKPQKSQSAILRQLSDFRIRVLDLLEIWLKTSPDLKLIIDVMVTALMLLENSLQTKADSQLQSRIKMFFKHLASIKNFKTDEEVTAETLIKLMEKAIYKGDKSTWVYINMSSEIVEFCTFILKLSLRDTNLAEELRPLILTTYKDALEHFYMKNNSIIPVDLFKSALTLQWEGLLDLIEDVVNYSLKPDVRTFYLNHTLNLLEIFLKNKRLLTTEDDDKYKNVVSRIAQKLADNVNIFKGKFKKFHLRFVQLCKMIKQLNIASDIIDPLIDNNKNTNGKRKTTSDDDSSLSKGIIKKLKRSKNEKDAGVEETEEETAVEQDSSTSRVNKRKNDNRNKVLLKKKKAKLFNKTDSSGLMEGIFGSHLFNNSKFIDGKIGCSEEEEDEEEG